MNAPATIPPINILFLLNSAGVGGAEMQTISLLNGLDPGRFRVSLAYPKDEDDLLPRIDRSRVGGPVFCCHVSRKLDWRAARQLAACIRNESIDIVVCTNTYPLLYGALARRLSGRAARVHIVEVFHTTQMASFKGAFQMCLYRPLLRVCDMLVYVCENQRRYWRARLLAARADVVIHNGVDTGHFADSFSPAGVHRLREAHGFSSTDYVVGLCAYMRPEKAHGDLLAALARVRNA
ncbi:MAG TPA: glycosyltransferase, partial [Telluria sp.]